MRRLLKCWFLACGVAINVVLAALAILVLAQGHRQAERTLDRVLSDVRAIALSTFRVGDDLASRWLGVGFVLKDATGHYGEGAAAVPLAAGLGYGRILRVGPGREFDTPGAAARVAQPGDVVEIDPGEYRDDSVVWRTPDLLVRGMGGTAHINGTGTRLVQEKGIWLIQADNVRIENVEFSGAVSRDRNGAGIRAEGDRLHVVHCFFHDNETAILANPIPGGSMTVEFSVFARNGHEDGRAHQVYVNAMAELKFRFNYLYDTRTGSALKSRATVNRIGYNRIVDGAKGTSNYALDLSDGGQAYVVGNVFEQGPGTGNAALVAFAPESGRGPEHEIRLVHNTLVSDHYFAYFLRNWSGGTAHMYNNLMIGTGTPVTGSAIGAGNVFYPDRLRFLARLTPGGRRVLDPEDVVSAAGIASRPGLDYRLTASSPAIGAGVPLAAVDEQLAAPQYEFTGRLPPGVRSTAGPPDAGAFEYRP